MSRERTAMIAAGYDKVAEKYLALEAAAEWPRMKWLGRVLAELEPGSRVLDLGCGNGLPATKAAAAARHQVTGIDVSARMVEMARENVPAADFVVSSVEAAQLPERHFDAALAFYLFDHVPRDELQAVLGRVRRWLKPGGFLLATFETADLPDMVGDWLGVPMFFSCYPPEQTKRVIEECGFRIRRAEVETQIESSTEIPYLWVIAQARLGNRPGRAQGEGQAP